MPRWCRSREPLVKWAVEVTRLQDLPRIVRRAAKVATTPPTGPVFISLPGDILDAEAELDLGKSTRVDAATRPSDATLDRLAARLLTARNPVLIAGHELATRDALEEAAELAEAAGRAGAAADRALCAPISCPSTRLSSAPSRAASSRSGLRCSPMISLVFLGADVLRMSVYSAVDPLPDGTAVVQISERDWELGKNYPAEIAIKADVKETLRALVPVVRRKRSAERAAQSSRRLEELKSRNWTATRERADQGCARRGAREAHRSALPDVADRQRRCRRTR